MDEQSEVPEEWLLRVQRDPAIQIDSSRRRDCPRCDAIKLKRHFFSANRQIEVDLCPGCGGYWLDAGELEKIRAEKASAAAAAEVRDVSLTMQTVRFLYREKMKLTGRN